MRTRRPDTPFDDHLLPWTVGRRQCHADLAAALELDIDTGEELRVEQCAVLLAFGKIDAEARAQRVQRVLRAGELPARQHERAVAALPRDLVPPASGRASCTDRVCQSGHTPG